MKKSKKMKQAASLGLASLLTVSSLYSGGPTYAASKENSGIVSQLLDGIKKEGLKKIKETAEFDDAEKVRVIIELEGEPAIKQATKKGIMYKDLKTSQKESLEDAIKEEQQDFIDQVKKEKIDLKVQNSFTTVLNGISGEVEFGDIEVIEKIPGVESVSIATEYERPKEKPNMISSKEMVEAQQTWNAGYDGKGMVVGIIDTGLDYNHKDMKLTDKNGIKLTKDSVSNIVDKEHLKGKFYTEKIPYGYNYMDKNEEILDLGPDASMHGMHVGGTVGANGDESKDGIKGVAPGAQLLALKVFGNDPAMPSTFGDVYIKAIDDGIKLGADVLNMSLGSTAGFVDDNNMEQKAVDNAVQNGIVMSISAGNSDNISGEFGKNPFATNPDIGLVGAPSVSKSSLSVASIENNKITLDQMSMKFGNETLSIAYKKQSSPDPLEVFGNAEKDVVYVGDGSAAQYTGKDVKGKVVFASRVATNPNYGEIQAQAEKAGAAGVIVKGHPSHGDYVSMALNSPTIPLVSLSQSDGNTLISKFTANNGTGKVTFTGKTATVANSAAGHMSDFTSWGVTPSLEMKPEITAPGGQIYSTLNDNKYGVMSGTSMAAPHVSGGSALVLQRVQQLFPELKNEEKSKRAKVLLMNTAKPVEDPDHDGIYYSPRRQGSGIMQLHSAVSTPVYVTKKDTNEAKVELKEIKDDSFTFTLTATNVSKDDASYKVDTSVLTDAVAGKSLALAERNISKAKVTVDTPEFTLFAGKSKDITIRVDLKDAKAELEKLMPNGYFVEGFVRLINTKDQGFPDLTVPYVGYKGDWNKPPVLDNMVYDQGSYLDTSFMVDEEGYALGQNAVSGELDKNTIAISPNADKFNDSIAPVLTFLRNSKEVEYSITDKDGNKLRTLATDKNQSKNYKATAPYVYKPSKTTWDGFIKSSRAEDGLYYYQVKTQVDYDGKDPQVMKIPVIVDTKKPVVNNVSYSAKNGILSFDAADERSGLQFVQVQVNGKAIGNYDASKTKSFKINLKNVNKSSTISVLAVDNAYNVGGAAISNVSDDMIPYVITTAPEALGVYDTREIPVTGYVADASKVEDLTVKADKLEGGSVTIPLKYNEKTKNYEFSTQLKFTEDGVHDLYFSSKDSVGNKIEFRRQVFIDTTPAEIEVSGIPEGNFVAADDKDPILKVKAADNFDELRLVVDGEEVYAHEFDEPFEMRHHSHEAEVTLDYLKTGRNVVTIEATDLAGHVTKKNIVIYKGTKPEGAVTTSYEFGPAADVSTENPAILKAEASDSVKWAAKVIDSEGKEFTLDSAEGKTFTATFTPDDLAPSGQYTLLFGQAGSDDLQEVTFTVSNYPVVIAGPSHKEGAKAIEVKKEDGILSIAAKVANRGDAKTDAQVIVQVKNSDEEVVAFETFSLKKLNKGARDQVAVNLPLDSLEKGEYTAEVFVWSSLDDPTPLAKTESTQFSVE